MNVGDLVQAMESIAPPRFAAPWDNVGLLVGDAGAALSRVLLAIDCTGPVAEEARRSRCEAIVAYHPVLFAAQKRFVAGSVAYDLARAGVAVYSPHTALDAADGGTNDVLADAIGMTGRAPLRPAGAVAPAPVDPPCGDARPRAARRGAGTPAASGFGRVGAVAPAPLRKLVESIKAALGISRTLVAGSLERPVSRAAVCAGSGGELLADAIGAGAEVFVTGELGHHDALAAIASGVAVVCTLHSASERCALEALERRLVERLPGVSVARSAADREPFEFA